MSSLNRRSRTSAHDGGGAKTNKHRWEVMMRDAINCRYLESSQIKRETSCLFGCRVESQEQRGVDRHSDMMRVSWGTLGTSCGGARVDGLPWYRRRSTYAC